MLLGNIKPRTRILTPLLSIKPTVSDFKLNMRWTLVVPEMVLVWAYRQWAAKVNGQLR